MNFLIKLIRLSAFGILFLPVICYSNFTISAEVENKATIRLNQRSAHNYFEDLTIYPKFFPDIVGVTDNGNNQSEWTYRVDYPLAEAWNAVFEQFKSEPDGNILVYESNSADRNYLKCRATFTSVSNNQTSVDIYIKVILTREKASDIHFLAGVLGEKFISEKMKDKLSDDLNTFIDNISKDIYTKN